MNTSTTAETVLIHHLIVSFAVDQQDMKWDWSSSCVTSCETILVKSPDADRRKSRIWEEEPVRHGYFGAKAAHVLLIWCKSE